MKGTSLAFHTSELQWHKSDVRVHLLDLILWLTAAPLRNRAFAQLEGSIADGPLWQTYAQRKRNKYLCSKVHAIAIIWSKVWVL